MLHGARVDRPRAPVARSIITQYDPSQVFSRAAFLIIAVKEGERAAGMIRGAVMAEHGHEPSGNCTVPYIIKVVH